MRHNVRDKFGRFKAKAKKSPKRAARRKAKREVDNLKDARHYPLTPEQIYEDELVLGKGFFEQIEEKGKPYNCIRLSPDDMLRLLEEFGQIPFVEAPRRLEPMFKVEHEEEGIDTPSELMEHIEI